MKNLDLQINSTPIISSNELYRIGNETQLKTFLWRFIIDNFLNEIELEIIVLKYRLVKSSYSYLCVTYNTYN
jgi:hypothetical protein